MRYTVICEKPSVSAVLAQTINESFQKRDNVYCSANYQIHSLSGHIFELFDMEDYENYPSKSKYWDLNALPFFPKDFIFQYKLMKKTGRGGNPKKIFDNIKASLQWADAVIHVGDNDAEGQTLVDNVLFYANCQKPIFRLIQESNTIEEMQIALQRLESNDEPKYRSLAMEGYIRAWYDWLYGINASRYASLKFGSTFHVGRVITAIVMEIYKRDYGIHSFVPEPYYQNINTIGIALTSKETYKDEEDAIQRAQEYNTAGAFVTKRSVKKTEINPGKLFSQNTIQGYMGRFYKITPGETLKAIQSLYDQGYMSYPRTESEYLKTEEMNKVKSIIRIVSELGFSVQFKNNKRIFNDKKVVAHSALIPTRKVPDVNKLSEIEKNVYLEIFYRFVEVFYDTPCLVNRTTLEIKCIDEIFTVKGDIYIHSGWKGFRNTSTKDRELPNLNIGDKIPVKFETEKKMTVPPKHYTTDTFLKFLDNPFSNEQDEDEDVIYANIRRGATIGKTSTRAAIIDKAKEAGYISLKKDIYRIDQKGVNYIQSLHKLGIDLRKENTVKMGVMQTEVATGKIPLAKAMEEIKADVEQMFAKRDQIFMNVIARCPACGGNVYEEGSRFHCENNDLIFLKNNAYFKAVKKEVTAQCVSQLLMNGSTILLNCISKKGKTFNVKLIFRGTKNGFVQFDTEFIN